MKKISDGRVSLTRVSASILAADFSNLEREIKDLEAAGADMIHIDVMDGHFVPNISFGPCVINSIRKHTDLPFDVHLMVDQPERFLQSYKDAGADILTIHPEATMHLDRTIAQIKGLGMKAGVSLLPASGVDVLDYVLDDIDLILVMSVNPGFGGQKFLHSQLRKISILAKMIAGREVTLAVDGGVNDETAQLCRKAGADTLIAGSYIFKGDYGKRIASLKGNM